jgi:GntR family transcriptional repressor for pyruvate dehydrogenase complex
MIRHRLDAKLPEQLALKLEKAILAQQYRPGQTLMQTDLLEFREMLEIRCAELAAQRAEAPDLARLATCHADVTAAYSGADRARQVLADVAFHRAIADATRNPVFTHLVGSLLELLHEHVLISIASLEAESPDVRQLRQQHTRLFERITARDAVGAAQAARAHIAFVRRSWQQRLA